MGQREKGEELMPIEKICPICGTHFKVRPRDKDRIYCSKKCHGVTMRGVGNPMYGVPGPMLGKHHTEETRKKISLSKIGDKNPAFKPCIEKECPVCHKLFEVKPFEMDKVHCSHSCANKDREPPSEELRQRLSDKAKIQWADPDNRKKLIESFKKRPPTSDEERKRRSIRSAGANNPMYGVSLKHSEEAKKLMSVARKGKKFTPEHCKNMGDARRGKKFHPLSEEHRRKIGEASRNVPRTEEWCKNIGKSRLGEKSHFWKGGIANFPYCPKFNDTLRENVRETFHGKCVFPGCGKTKIENKGRRLHVHHVFVEKMTCCETNIKEMDAVRKRLPKNIVKFGEPEFTEGEKMYIRMMVPLCSSHHAKVGREPIDIPYEDTVYRKYFAELIMNEYGGKCFKNGSS